MMIDISHTVKILNRVGARHGVFGEPAYHLAARHLTRGAFFDNFAAYVFSEGAAKEVSRRRQIWRNGAAVLLGGEI